MMLPRNRLGEGSLGWPSRDHPVGSRRCLAVPSFRAVHPSHPAGMRARMAGSTSLLSGPKGEAPAVSRLHAARSQAGTFVLPARGSVARHVTTRRSGCFVPTVRLELPPQRAGGNQDEGAFFLGPPAVMRVAPVLVLPAEIQAEIQNGSRGRGVAEVPERQRENERACKRLHAGMKAATVAVRCRLRLGPRRSHRDETHPMTIETILETSNPTDKPN
jgi:hypothetical protein